MLPKTWGIPAAALAAVLLAGTASAQDASRDKEQLELMKQQLIQLQKKMDSLQGRVSNQEQRSAEISAEDIAARKLLTDCAANADRDFFAGSATDLDDAFKEIAKYLSELRISK